jgi:hypothetical protein
MRPTQIKGQQTKDSSITLGKLAQEVIDAMSGEVVTVADVEGLQAALDGKAPTAHGHAVADVSGLQTALDGKQATLVSGTNIKTVNGESLLGAGNIEISGSAERILTPTALSPASGATDVMDVGPLVSSTYYSAYGIAHGSSRYQVYDAANTLVHDSNEVSARTSYSIPAAILQVSTVYKWRVQYKDVEGFWSGWSAPFSFTTAAQFDNVIPTPTPTPGTFGAALDGGFYAGMIWNEITTSAASTVIGTGSKTFTVPDMTATPIVYLGQTIEVRSRANPVNKMIGTVTSATGTSLVMNVTSVGGSGTFTDWSVMCRFRIIVAPKASGQNADVVIKNADTAFPQGCYTLTEGLTATNAMRDAGTSTVYPAAHWARNLTIGGYNDWHIPARDALELCWRNLKPVTNNNHVTADRATGASQSYMNRGSYGDTANTHGLNNNSSPTGAAYTASVPGQTVAAAFQAGGAEAFEFGSLRYWSSTEYSASHAWAQRWDSSTPGRQHNSFKTNTGTVRAVRRSPI